MHKTIEVPTEQAKEAPMTVDAISARLTELREQHEKKEIAPMDYRNTLADMRAQIESPYGVENATPEALAKLRTEFDSLPAVAENEKRIDPMSAPLVASKAQETWYKPQTWSPETRQAAGWGLGVGIGLMGLVLLTRAAWKGTKEYVKATGEKVGWFWGKVKWAIGLTVAAGLGYVGVRIFQDYKKITDLKKQLETAMKLGSTLKKGTAEWLANQKMIQELERAIQGVKDGVTPKANNTNTAAEEAQKKAQDAAEAVKKKAREIAEDPRTQEGIEKAKTMTTERLVAKVILAQNKKEWDTLGSEAKENQIIGLLENNGTKTMDEIENNEEFPFEIPEDTQDRPNRLRSGEVMLDYCQASHTTVLEKIMHDKKCTAEIAAASIGKLTLMQYLECALRGNSMYIKTMEAVSALPRSLEEFSAGLQQMPFTDILNDEEVKATILSVMKDMQPEDMDITQEELENIDATSVLMAALSLDHGPLVNAKQELQKKCDTKAATPTERVLFVIMKSMTSDGNKTHLLMLPLFHGVFPDNDPNKTPEEQVRTYFLDRMTAAEALRFYMYDRMLSQGNALILPIMQMEVIRFIARHDNSRFRGSKKYEAIAGLTGDLFADGGEKIIEEWQKLGLNINIQLTDDEKDALKLMGKHFALTPLAGGYETFLATLGTYEKYPWLIGGTVLGTGALKVAAVRTPYLKKFSLSHTDPETFSQLLDSLPNTTGPMDYPTQVGAKFRRSRPLSFLLYSHEELSDAKGGFHIIFEKGIKESANRDEATKLLRDCIANPRVASRWRALATELDGISLEAADQARKFASGVRLRGALSSLRLPFTLKNGGFLWSAVTLPTRVAAVAIDRTIMKGVDVVSDSAKPLKAAAENAFEELYKNIRATRAAKEFGKLVQLLKSSASLIKTQAAAGNRTAQALLGILRFAENAKWASGKILPIIGPVIDIAMLGVNRYEMEEARKANNMEMVETMKSKEKVLLAQCGIVAGVGAWSWLMVGPQGLIIAPFAITSSIIANNIYNSVIQWETTSKQWMNEEPEALLAKLKELKVGYRDSGHNYGNLTFEKGEEVNQYMRQEILTAYFLKTVQFPVIQNETASQTEGRIMRGIQTRLAYVKATTGGTYDKGVLASERFFDDIEDYAHLTEIQRSLDDENQPRVLTYEWDGKQESLDLSALDYIRRPKTGNEANDDKRQMAYFAMMNKYRDEYLVLTEAIRDVSLMMTSA